MIASLLAQAAAEYVSTTTTGTYMIRNFVGNLQQAIRQSPLETGAILLGLLLAFMLVARFNDL